LPSSLVRKMRSPQTAGVEPPRPGSGSVQATFFVASHSVGRFVSLLMPSSVGPRHWGQLSARAAGIGDSSRADRVSRQHGARRRFTAAAPRGGPTGGTSSLLYRTGRGLASAIWGLLAGGLAPEVPSSLRPFAVNPPGGDEEPDPRARVLRTVQI